MVCHLRFMAFVVAIRTFQVALTRHPQEVQILYADTTSREAKRQLGHRSYEAPDLALWQPIRKLTGPSVRVRKIDPNTLPRF